MIDRKDDVFTCFDEINFIGFGCDCAFVIDSDVIRTEQPLERFRILLDVGVIPRVTDLNDEILVGFVLRKNKERQQKQSDGAEDFRFHRGSVGRRAALSQAGCGRTNRFEFFPSRVELRDVIFGRGEIRLNFCNALAMFAMEIGLKE
jgi:hypothetical protein